MREVVVDTETSGLEYAAGDRIVEIGCVELIDRKPGRTWQTYVNPERDVPDEVVKVHGLTREFLQEHPTFDMVADAFLEFIGDSPLVIHNASFDIAFLNTELKLAGRDLISFDRLIDTLPMARRMFSSRGNSLDELCKKLQVDNRHREKHGALLDAELLAQVYVELLYNRQGTFDLTVARDTVEIIPVSPRVTPLRRPQIDIAAHRAFVAKLKNAIWRDYQ